MARPSYAWTIRLCSSFDENVIIALDVLLHPSSSTTTEPEGMEVTLLGFVECSDFPRRSAMVSSSHVGGRSGMTQNAVPHVEEEVVWYSIVNSSSGTALLYFRHGGGRETGDREAWPVGHPVQWHCAVAVGPGVGPSSELWASKHGQDSSKALEGSRLEGRGPRPRGDGWCRFSFA